MMPAIGEHLRPDGNSQRAALQVGHQHRRRAADLQPRAQRVHAALQAQGALFFEELSQEAHLLPSELETALQELVGAGLVGADSFIGLRCLITPAAKRKPRISRRGRPALFSDMAHAGRWALLRRTSDEPDHDLRLEYIARALLRRYGVICWRLLARESDALPSWQWAEFARL